MKFTSSENPELQCEEELVILEHNDQRVLVPLPSTYEEAQSISKEEFSLHGSLEFETTEWPGFKGTSIKIHSKSWKNACPLLKRVIVKEITQPTSKLPACPTCSLESQVAGPSQPFPMSKPNVGSSQTTIEAIPKSSHGEGFIHSNSTVFVKPSPASALQSSHQPPKYPVDTAGRHSSGEDSTSEVVEVVLPKVTPNPRVTSFKPTIMNGNDEQPSAPKPTNQRLHNTTTGNKRPMMTTPELPPKKKIREEHMENENGTSGGVNPQDAPVPPEQQNTNRIEQEESVNEIIPRRQPQASKETNPLDDHDDTCLIEIQYNDDGNIKSSLFKTRGRHPIEKVLRMACRTFGINYTNNLVHLAMIMDDVNGDGETEQILVPCPSGSTMAKVGALPNSLFEVVVPSNTDED